MELQILVVGLSVATAASLLGVLVILRRLALVSDALSHVALPGLAVALVLGMSPFIGAFSFLFLSILFVHFIQKKFEFGTETLIGVLFTTALAIGILVTPDEHLLEALFGEISSVGLADLIIAVAGGVVVFIGTLMLWRGFLKILVSPELAMGEQVRTKWVELAFLFLLALTVAIGIKVIGTLLMGALVILPAATAKNISRGVRQMVLFSLLIGIGSVLLGLWAAGFWHWPPGPTVVLLNSVLFAISLFL